MRTGNSINITYGHTVIDILQYSKVFANAVVGEARIPCCFVWGCQTGLRYERWTEWWICAATPGQYPVSCKSRRYSGDREIRGTEVEKESKPLDVQVFGV